MKTTAAALLLLVIGVACCATNAPPKNPQTACIPSNSDTLCSYDATCCSGKCSNAGGHCE